MSQVSFTEPSQWVWYMRSICVCGVCVCARVHTPACTCVGKSRTNVFPSHSPLIFFFMLVSH